MLDALRSPAERLHRRRLLAQPHMMPLAEFAAQMRAMLGPDYHIPDFDPCDGGTQARALFLLEAPGPKAMLTGFTSRDNPNATARNLSYLMENAGIKREETLLWNIVPWYVGSGQRIRPVNAQDIAAARPHLKALFNLLTALEFIVLVGRKSQSAHDYLRQLTTVPILMTYHMSPQVFHISPERKHATQAQFAEIARLLG